MTDYLRLSRVLSITAIVCWGLPTWLSAAPSVTLSGCGDLGLSAAGASARIAETTKPPEAPKPDKTADEEEDCD
ncbi:MAG: hypothetical protein PVJ03_07105 [Chromatiaceae bacterium]|jgi:hypothetical protein